jgi:hypothetical protein
LIFCFKLRVTSVQAPLTGEHIGSRHERNPSPKTYFLSTIKHIKVFTINV